MQSTLQPDVGISVVALLVMLALIAFAVGSFMLLFFRSTRSWGIGGLVALVGLFTTGLLFTSVFWVRTQRVAQPRFIAGTEQWQDHQQGVYLAPPQYSRIVLPVEAPRTVPAPTPPTMPIELVAEAPAVDAADSPPSHPPVAEITADSQAFTDAASEVHAETDPNGHASNHEDVVAGRESANSASGKGPKWIDWLADSVERSTPHQWENDLVIVVGSGPCETTAECDAELNRQAHLAALTFAKWFLAQRHQDSRWVHLADDVEVPRIDFHNDVYEQTHDLVIAGESHVMPVKYALVRFSKTYQGRLDNLSTQTLQASRLMTLLIGSGVVLGGVFLAFGYLQINRFSQGSYAGRLRAASGVAILVLVAAGVLMARWIPWM
ncbi:MAG: hypothetical protein R3E01_29765 [Pirellulaceae bacterium]|nr:hypothetical protein [Planctomycetales bacterium]